MSELAQILNIVFAHMEKHGQAVETLQAGLTRRQINKIAAILPFQLPDEVCELYQWRNGGAEDVWCDFLPMYRLLSLEEAVEYYHDRIAACQDAGVEAVIDKSLLPVFAEDCNYYSVQCGTVKKQSAAMFCDMNEELPELVCPDLLSFMQAIEKCWASGVFRVDEQFSPDQYGHFDADYEKMEQVFARYASTKS